MSVESEYECFKNRKHDYKCKKLFHVCLKAKEKQQFNKSLEKKLIQNNNAMIFKPKLPKVFYVSKLRDWSEEIPIIGISLEWEKNIIKLIPHKYKSRYPSKLKKLMEEMKHMYIDDMRTTAINSIVIHDNNNKILSNDDDDNEQYFNTLKIDGQSCSPPISSYRSKNVLFYSNRKSIEIKYLLSHALMRYVMNTAYIILPPTIIQLEKYRDSGVLEMLELKVIIKKSIKIVMTDIRNKFYKGVTVILLKINSTKMTALNSSSKFINCLENLFTQQILSVMMQTIDNIIDTLKNSEYRPQLNFQLVFENNCLVIEPSIDQIINFYNEIMIDIENIAQNLLCFECYIKRNGNKKIKQTNLKVKVPEWFTMKCHSELKLIIINMFKPMYDDFHKLSDQLEFIYNPETKKNTQKLIAENHNFNIYYQRIEVFNSYLEKVYSMENYMYYNVGVLNQLTAKEKLKNVINEIKGILINKLKMYHFNYNEEICQEFEDLKSKALNIPNNTKDLFELSEQMALASTITIEKLENKIRESIEMLSALMQITPITEEHIELNKNTINWLTLIQDIFNQSNSLCEGMKSELEDELQKKINVLNTQVDVVVPSLIILDDMDDAQRAHEYIEYLDILVRKIQAIDKQVEEINLDEKLFKFPETQFPKIQEIKDIILPFYDLIIMINEWTRYSSIWMDGPYEYIDSNHVEKTTNYYFEKFSELNQLLKKKIKADSQSANKLFKFSGIIDDPDPMQQSAPLKLCFQVLEQVKQFNQYIPLINCMCNKALARRHWKEMSIIYGNDLTPNAGTTLRKIIALDLMKDIDKYQVISISANKELLLQQQLEMMNKEWNDINFTIENDCTKDNKFLFVQFPKIQLLLEHHLVLTEEMISSYFVKPIITEVRNFRESLLQVRDIVQKWNYIQDECVFFKQIFINNQSSASTKDFEELSTLYLKVISNVNNIMKNISLEPKFIIISKYASSYLDQLTDTSATIEHITVGINDYLEYARSNFPRFYFLSNIEIIEILFNQADSVTKVKKLLQKCFCGINNIQLNSKNEVISIISDHNEILTLTNNTICLNSLQNNNTWLTFIESTIIMSVRNKIGSNCINLNINIDNLVDGISKLIKNTYSLALITECTLKLFWTSSIQQCLIQFHTSKFKLLLYDHNQFINNLIIELKEISPRCQRIVLMSHVVFSINQQEIISQLVNKNVQHENDFYWIVQLRYYFQNDNNVQVYMLNSMKNYKYEFMSTGESFINTPLTDRCYRILFEGANNNFFGALIGSTGIGKIETIKSLSRALAVKLYPIHCTQCISYQYITQIFKGFMACGFWMCFKNINNLPLNILSLLINNIYTISQILCSTATKIITFEGLTKLPINKSSGFIAVTVNLGVSTSLKQLSINNYLTDNFNVIFRVIAYTNSDINKICEIKLFASGFINAKSLSNKIVDIYKFISSHQFSSHFKIPYNVEYQSINTIIKTAINLKFKFPNLDDEMIIVRSLMDIYLPCFPNNEVIIFQEFLESYFPQIIRSTSSLLTNNYTTLFEVLEQIMEKSNLEVHEPFKLKIIQLFEMIFIKNGLIILGESLSGKTTIIESFIKCLSILNNNDNDNNGDNFYWINQNCMTIENLLGYFNVKLEKWYDGVFTSILRDANDYSNVQSNSYPSYIHKKWVIFDGSIDNSSFLIDNMNTLLDNDKLFFLPTGEIIEAKYNNISIMFETDNLNNASPSTISRCGIIYVDSFNTRGWRFYARIWMKNQKFDVEKKYYEFLSSMLEWSLDACLCFINQKCTLVAAVSDSYLVISTLKLFDIHLKDAFSDGSIETKEKLQYFGLWCQAALILAIIWAIGGCLTVDHQSIFNEFCLSLWNNEIKDHQRPELLKICDSVPLPTEGTIHDNKFIFKAAGSWKHWSDILKSNYSMDIEICDDFNNLMVPTTDSIKYINLFLNHIKYRVPFIINGESSIGKTSCIRYLLKKKLPNTKNLAYMYRFTQTTSVSQAKNCFIKKIVTTFEDNKELYINYIDDLNVLINSSKLKCHSILDLIRQYIDHGYWYDDSSTENKNKKLFLNQDNNNIIFLCGLTSFNEQIKTCYNRFLRHFNFYTMFTPNKDNLLRIFSNILLFNLKRNQFSNDIVGSINSIVNSIIHVYINIKNFFHPTPTQIFYQFDIADIARVINGCSLIHRESVETKITLIRLWIHESLRVFGDRITVATDYEFLLKKIEEAVGIYFKDTFDSIFDHLPKYNGKLTRQSFSNLMFTNFAVDNTSTSISSNSEEIITESLSSDNIRVCRYEEISSKDALKNKLIACLNEFNRLNVRKIDIVILTNIVEHLIRICRVLTLPGGQLIMFCTGGTGRRSLARLAAFIQKQKFFQLSTTSTISNKNDSDDKILLNEWRNSLKSILKICGGHNQDCTYFIPGRYIQDTYFDDISNLLTTGEILDLFRADEKREIIEISRLLAQKGDRNLELKTSQIMDYFFNQCKLKLHFILYFNVYDNNKRTLNKLKLWKNLIKYCFIDCYVHWPPEAFTELGNYLLIFDDHVHIDHSTKEKIITTCKYLYDKSEELQMDYYKKFNRIIHVYNPSAFIYMIKLFCQLLNKKQAEIIDLQNKYLSGLNKLLLASEQVNKMKTILTSLKPQLEESVQKMQNTMREIENENITVETTTIQVKRDEEVANRKAKIASTLKSECEADLAVAIPILEDAIAALNTLKPTDITLVKAMKNPPDTVKLVMAAVCVMLGVPAEKVIDPITGRKSMDFWGPSKRILSDMNFLQNLKDYDKDNIPSGIMQVIKKTYMVDKSFMPHIVAKASSAAEGLCKWVRAMVSYDEVVKVVAPKKEKLAGAEKEYNETIAFLNNKRKILSALNDKLTTLNDNLKLTVINKMELESEITKCTERLVKAEKLIKSLGGEKQKWTESVDSLKTSHKNLVGDLIMSCAIVIYLSPCHLAFRDINIEKWKDFLLNLDISYSTDFNFVDVIKAGGTTVNPSHYRHFENNRFYTENALIYYYSQKYCLFIDPENQANSWIKDIELKNDLKIIQINSNNCLEDIKRCIRNGQPVLIENNIQQHYFSLPLEFIFTRSNIYSMNNKQYLYINKEVIEYHPNFRLYITTRFDNPIYESYIFEKITIINFLLPTQVICNKLLDIIVSRECPEYQEIYDTLLIQNIDNKQVLKQEENNILSILSTSTVNILEDENSIKLLDSTKILFYDLQRKDKEIKIEIDKINLFRNNYNELAQYCANLFNTLTILTHLNCMYKFSYHWFLQLYIKSISNSNTSVKLDKRLNYLKLSFTKILHCNVVNALYEKHKLLYTFLLCLKLSINNNNIPDEEYQYFIENCITSTTQTKIECYDEEEKSQDDSWITEKIWMQISTLSNSMEAFQGLEQSIKYDDQLLWKNYYNAKTPENHCLPEPWEDKLTSFQKLILVSIIRPDRMLMKVLKFISTVTIDNTNLLDYLDLPLNLSYMYSQSNWSTPLLFILPCYIDLSTLLDTFASKLGYSSKFDIISSSYFNLNHQNYSHELRRIISDAKKDGKWLFIQDCHLAIPQLSKELESINNHSDNSNIDIEFRLWLSSCPTDQFPINILQDSIKLTYNKPKTVKKSLIHSYNTEPLNSYDFFNNCSGKNKIFSRLLFSLSFFHAIIGERNYFNDPKWNVKYDFSHYDLVISAKQLKTLLLLLNDSNNSNQVSYEALTYFIGDCSYGGRIIDATDRRCLISILQDYFNEKIIQQYRNLLSNCSTYNCYFEIPDKCSEYHDYVRQINMIENHDLVPATIFGLNDNAEIQRNTLVFENFCNCFKLIINKLPETNYCNDKERHNEELISQKIDEIKEKLPKQLISSDKQKIKMMKKRSNKFLRDYYLNMIFIDEIKIYNSVLQSIIKSLQNDVNNDDRDDCINDLMINVVPKSWLTFTFNSKLCVKSLSKFIVNINRRYEFLNGWIQYLDGDDDQRLLNIWLGGLEFPHRLFIMAQIFFSKQYDVAVDQIKSYFVVTPIYNESDLSAYNVDNSYVRSMYFNDLYLSGAKWDSINQKLISNNSKIQFNRMPIVQYSAIVYDPLLDKKQSDHNCYICPLYKSTVEYYTTSNFITRIKLPTNISYAHIVKNGTRLFCLVE